MTSNVKIIFGVPYSVGKEFEDVLEEYNVKDLDTGASYPGSEKSIGDDGLPAKYAIHTKAMGWVPESMTYDKILASAHRSLERLQVKKVKTYFLHSPDPATPISETLDAIQKLSEDEMFTHFGISNFLPKDVQKVYDYCASKNYVLPSVYEGYYSPIGRHTETELLPLLRKLNIRYHAYGALAGGFLTKSPGFFNSNVEGTRWDINTGAGKMYNSLYNKPCFIEALLAWEQISKDSGSSKADLAYRWVAYNSKLNGEFDDGIVLGASKVVQLRGTLEGLKDGPLEMGVVERIDGIWEGVKSEAIMDNFNREKKS